MTFQEIFFTVVVIWIIFKIFRPSSSRAGSTFNFNMHRQPNKNPKEGQTTVTKPATSQKKDITDGEYVDFEEVKVKDFN